MPTLNSEQWEEVRRRYIAGESSNVLSSEFGVSRTAICGHLKRRGIGRRDSHARKLSPQQEGEVCRRYLAKESANALSKVFRVDVVTILNTLRRNEVPERSHSERQRLIADPVEMSRRGKLAAGRSHGGILGRRSPGSGRQPIYTANHSFFDVIDSEQKAYWLGFIGADGCVRVHGNSPRLEMCLAVKDAEHLRRLRNALESNHKVSAYQTARFAICSKSLMNGLVQHGVHPRKSLTYEWPDFLPDNLLRHYLRGYFDGDGSFGITTKDQAVATIVGTEAFLVDCRDYLMRNLGFPKNRLRTTGAAYMLHYGGNKQMKRFAHLLYDNATVCLPRKRDKVAHLLYR